MPPNRPEMGLIDRLLLETQELEDAWKAGDLSVVEAILEKRGSTIQSLAQEAGVGSLARSTELGDELVAQWQADKAKLLDESGRQSKTRSARKAYKANPTSSGMQKAG